MRIPDLDTPDISHGNLLARRITEYLKHDKFPIVLNPPYGGNEQEGIRNNFPTDLKSYETADLFIVLSGSPAIAEELLLTVDTIKAFRERHTVLDFKINSRLEKISALLGS